MILEWIAFVSRLVQPLFQSCVSPGAAAISYGLVEGSGGGENPHVAFRAGDGGVD